MSAASSEFRRGALLVAGGLCVYALVAWTLSSAAQTRNETPERAAIAFDFGPNTVESEELTLKKSGFEYDCVECHYDQKRDARPRHFIGEHRALDFSHGGNNKCFNCHHPDADKVDQLVAIDGTPMSHNDHVKLCAQCHGVVYRDWKHGAHGRRSGYWDRKAGKTERTDCIVCHDPHHPKFAPIAPLPPPGVFVGDTPPTPPSHSVVTHLMQAHPDTPEKDTLRGPAIDPDDEFDGEEEE